MNIITYSSKVIMRLPSVKDQSIEVIQGQQHLAVVTAVHNEYRVSKEYKILLGVQ